MTSPGKKITVFKACQRDHHHGFRSWSTPVGGGGVYYFMNLPSTSTLEGTPLFAFDTKKNAWNFVRANSHHSDINGLTASVLEATARVSEIETPPDIRSLYAPREFSEFWSLVRHARSGDIATLGGLRFPTPKGTVLCDTITPRRECEVPEDLAEWARRMESYSSLRYE